MSLTLPSFPKKNEGYVSNTQTVLEGQLQVQTLATVLQGQDSGSDRPQRVKYFEIIWFQKGAGVLTVDLKKISIFENSIYCLAPGQFRDLKLESAAVGYYIALSAEYLHLIENQIDFSLLVERYNVGWNLPVIRSDGEIKELMARIHREYGSQSFMRSEILEGLVKVLLIYLSRRIEQTSTQIKELPNETELGFVRKFMRLLKKHFATKKLVSDYADELCITPNYLNFLVKKQTGFPASHHIQQCIIMEAKRQAVYSGLRMKEVADALGFEDYAHFSKFFKNYSGVNFSSFKKGILNNNFGSGSIRMS